MNATPVQPTSANWSDLELTPLGSATGGIGLPGDFSSPSRFVRVAFLRAQILMEDIENDGIIEFFHILNNVAMVKGSVITKDGKDEITVEELSKLSGRFNYEFVCCLGKRIPRVYTGGDFDLMK